MRRGRGGPTIQSSRGKDDCKHSYLLFLSRDHNFKLFLIQIMDPINEIPQCPAKCTLSCIPWHLGNFHKQTSHYTLGWFCFWATWTHSPPESQELILPSIYPQVQRKMRRAEGNSPAFTHQFQPLGSARGAPDPMFFPIPFWSIITRPATGPRATWLVLCLVLGACLWDS